MAVAARFSKLLDNCQEMQLSHLRPLVDRMFENADVALLDFAEKAESNMAQSLFFDAMNAVRKNRPLIEQRLYTGIRRGFEEFPLRPNSGRQTPETDPDAGELSLVDTEALETFVATRNAAGKLASRIMDRIFALKQRLTVINGGSAIEESEIPGGPAWLGAAFQQALDNLELEHKVRLVLLALFDKYVLSRADALYDEYNKRLIEADILPNLRYEVRKQAGGIEIVEKQAAPDNETETVANDTRGQDDDQSPSELGDELFGRICELMSGHRGRPHAGSVSAGASPAPGAGDGSTPATNDSIEAGHGSGAALLAQISSLQNSIRMAGVGTSGDDFIENIEVDQQFIGRLQDTLAAEREKIYKGIDRRRLKSADTNIIELVGMMFEYMLKEESLPNVVKALLSRLHTPLLKVAVIDRNFFTHQGHPARRLLNDMTAAGIRWVDESNPERGIFPKMREIVDRVLLDFKEDAGIFDDLLDVFTQAVSELEKRASRVEERTNEAAKGQEKLQAARERARREIGALCAGKAIAQPACDFLQRIMADKLTFVLLRSPSGEQSENWQQARALIARIVDSAAPPADDRQRQARQQALAALQDEIREATGTLQQADKDKLMVGLFELQSAVLTDAGMVVPAPVAPTVDEPAEKAPSAGKALSTEQKEMLEKLKNVPFGTWFEFNKPGQKKTRAKLSWRSTVTEKFMFVDQMGVKAAVVCMCELADCMLNGTARIVSAEKRPFVDRALSAIHRMLDHAA